MGNTASVMAIVAAVVGIGSAWHIANLVRGAESTAASVTAEAGRVETAAQRAADSSSVIMAQSENLAGLVSDATAAAARVGEMAGTAEALSAAVTRAEEILAEMTAARDTATTAREALATALAQVEADGAAVQRVTADAQSALSQIHADQEALLALQAEAAAAIEGLRAGTQGYLDGLSVQPSSDDMIATVAEALREAGIEAAPLDAALAALRQSLGE